MVINFPTYHQFSLFRSKEFVIIRNGSHTHEVDLIITLSDVPQEHLCNHFSKRIRQLYAFGMLAKLFFVDSQLMLLSRHINVIYFYDIDKLIKIAGVDLQ